MNSYRSLVVVVAALVSATGCPEEEPACTPEFVGEPGAPVELQIVHRSAVGTLLEGEEGGDVELFRPPQGGKVFLTAARVRNVEKCGLRLRAALIDQENEDQVIGLEGRPFPTRVTDDGWLEPLNPQALSSWANVPACPSRSTSREINGALFKLNVFVEDMEGNTGETEMMVVPRCVERGFLGEQCACECKTEYTLRDRCEEPDGGMALPDAGQTPDDGGQSLIDAGQSLLDAGQATTDGGSSTLDAG